MAGGFDSLGLLPEILRAVDELDWMLPTDIQDEAIPLILGGGDVMAAAETGSGKTGAFSLPMIQAVYERLHDAASKKDGANKEGNNNNNNNNEASSAAAGATPVLICQHDKDNMVLVNANGDEAFGQAEKQWTGGRATHGVKGGKYYYEATVLSKGICRLGFSTMAAHTELGRDAHGFGYGGTGMKSHLNNFDKYGETYGEGDVIGCYLDLHNDSSSPRIVYSKNGTVLGEAFKLNETVRKMALFPAYVLKGAKIALNFGQKAFKYVFCYTIVLPFFSCL
jgi:ATP-dependent RNA helicase DDX1